MLQLLAVGQGKRSVWNSKGQHAVLDMCNQTVLTGNHRSTYQEHVSFYKPYTLTRVCENASLNLKVRVYMHTYLETRAQPYTNEYWRTEMPLSLTTSTRQPTRELTETHQNLTSAHNSETITCTQQHFTFRKAAHGVVCLATMNQVYRREPKSTPRHVVPFQYPYSNDCVQQK